MPAKDGTPILKEEVYIRSGPEQSERDSAALLADKKRVAKLIKKGAAGYGEIDALLTASEQGGADRLDGKDRTALLAKLLTQAEAFPELLDKHQGSLRSIGVDAAHEIVSSSMAAIYRHAVEAEKKHSQAASDPVAKDEAEKLAHARLEALVAARSERDALGRNVPVTETTSKGGPALAYENIADFTVDVIHRVDQAAKSGQGAAELASMMQGNKDQPKLKAILEKELKYRYDHASSSGEKEYLGLVAAVYAQSDKGNMSAGSDPQMKSFLMGMALNPKYADLPKDMLQHPETRQRYDEFVQKMSAYIQDRVKADAFARNRVSDGFKAGHADEGLKTPDPACAGKAAGSRSFSPP